MKEQDDNFHLRYVFLYKRAEGPSHAGRVNESIIRKNLKLSKI